jgi:antitoxin (DNA-binding transcriptional repressor) of toxin-antitoxin stability system
MAATASVRDLRNRFPEVKKLLEQDGEVVVTEQGTPKYRLTPYAPPEAAPATRRKDYSERMRRHQPRPLSAAAAKALRDDNRGDR